MTIIRLIPAAVTCAGLVMAATQAGATTYIDHVTADLNAAPPTLSTSNNVDYTTWFVSSLPGFGAPFNVAVGDTIEINIALATPFTIPGSAVAGAYNGYLIGLTGQGFPNVDTASSNEVLTLMNGGSTVATITSSGSTTIGQLSTFPIDYSATSYTFNEMDFSFTVANLSGNPTVPIDTLSYLQVFEAVPVPLPASSGMLLTGILGLGGLIRSRSRTLRSSPGIKRL